MADKRSPSHWEHVEEKDDTEKDKGILIETTISFAWLWALETSEFYLNYTEHGCVIHVNTLDLIDFIYFNWETELKQIMKQWDDQ